MILLIKAVAGLSLVGQGLGEDAFAKGLAFFLAGSSLGIVALIASFYKNSRGVSIGFSVAAIGVWLLSGVHTLVANDYDYAWFVERNLGWMAMLLLHPPIFLAVANQTRDSHLLIC